MPSQHNDKPSESKRTRKSLGHYGERAKATWHKGRSISEHDRETFRRRSAESRLAKEKSLQAEPVRPINTPRLDPGELMPQLPPNGLRSLSLFSGGGGIDLGFDRAGYSHVASYDILSDAGITLRQNRFEWTVFGGSEGDVTSVDWTQYRDRVDVVHGGPPCQPFSSAGRQLGPQDERDLFPEFVRAVKQVLPRAFLAENVPALGQKKFAQYVSERITTPLEKDYFITTCKLSAAAFGVPQVRTRIFFVGLRRDLRAVFSVPSPTHDETSLIASANPNLLLEDPHTKGLRPCMGARYALGLPNTGVDGLAPTLRSGLTGPHHTTSILSSIAAQKQWERLEIWPNGVSANRDRASRYPTKNGHFRLSVQDCAILQGFPESWEFFGAVYMVLGQIGNSVAPPVAYHMAKAIAQALR